MKQILIAVKCVILYRNNGKDLEKSVNFFDRLLLHFSGKYGNIYIRGVVFCAQILVSPTKETGTTIKSLPGKGEANRPKGGKKHEQI